MQMLIHEVAKLCSISVRTLHYYDEIGLLRPTQATQAGYRLYGENELARLQQILFFRELDLPLKEIQAIMDNPFFDVHTALRRHRELLTLKRDRLNRLIDLVERIQKGEDTMSLQEFDKREIVKRTERFAQEAQERWGDTEAWSEFTTPTGEDARR